MDLHRLPPIAASLLFMLLPGVLKNAHATGAQPDSTIVLLSETEGQAQMGVLNTEAVPLLLNTTIRDVSDDGSETPVQVLALPTLSRMEPNGRQLVRFVLEKPSRPLTVQLLKRVSFEGVAPRPTHGADGILATVQVNVRQDIPMVVSPRGLVQDPEPWKKLVFELDAVTLRVHNPSAFVVRLHGDVDLLPAVRRVALFPRTYVLPGQSFVVTLPPDATPGSVHGLRLFPASPWGFAVGSYEVTLKPAAMSDTAPTVISTGH